MITTEILIGALVMILAAWWSSERRRARHADRWAAAVGIRRAPGESTRDLVGRVASRLRVMR